MRRRRVLVAGIVVLAAAAMSAAVGFSRAASAAPVLGGGADVAPANAAAFVALDTSMSSSQWQALDGLLAKFPGGAGLAGKLQTRFAQKTGLSWTNDVLPALGPEVDIVVLPTASGGKPDTVLLTQPSAPAKLTSLLHKASTSAASAPVVAHTGGWTVIGDSQAALDAVTGATTHLADDPAYQAATGSLAPGALVDAYANGAQARQLLSALGHTGAGGGKVVWAAGDAVASSGGLKLDGYVHRDGTVPQAYSSSLVDRIPAGALAVVDFQAGSRGNVEGKALPSPAAAALAKVAATLGGETALYVSPGAPIPSLTLVTHPSNAQAVLSALNDALAAAGKAAGKAAGGASAGGLSFGSILGRIQLYHSEAGGTLVVSTSQQAIDAFTGNGAKLSGDAAFQAAQQASGMPALTTGFAYVDLKDALPLVQGLAALSGASGSKSIPDMSALHAVTAFGTGASGGVEQFTVFLDVQ